jgi:hypothetical protein
MQGKTKRNLFKSPAPDLLLTTKAVSTKKPLEKENPETKKGGKPKPENPPKSSKRRPRNQNWIWKHKVKCYRFTTRAQETKRRGERIFVTTEKACLLFCVFWRRQKACPLSQRKKQKVWLFDSLLWRSQRCSLLFQCVLETM